MKPLLLAIALLCLLPAAQALSDQSLVILNNNELLCSMFPASDECTTCKLPDGWQSVGYSWEAGCPEEFQEIQLEPDCEPLKSELCCTENSLGLAGDCSLLAINNFKRKCAFADTVENCSLPGDWQKMPKREEDSAWLCPKGFEWVAGITCTPIPEQNGQQPQPLNGQQPLPARPEPDANESFAQAVLFLLAAIVVLVLIASIAITTRILFQTKKE